MNIALWLERAGRAHAQVAALGLGTRVHATFGESAERVARLAAALLATRRFKAGDRVGIFAKNSPDYVEVMHAIWHAGLAAVPINAKLHGAEAAWIAEHSECGIVFSSGSLGDHLAAHLARDARIEIVPIGGKIYRSWLAASPMPCAVVAPDDLAWLFYTSGTTGRPKGATITHGVLTQASFAYLCEVDPCHQGDSILHAAPMSHGSGLYIMGTLMRLGMNVVPESGGFEPDEIAKLMNHWRGMSMFAAPTMIKRMVAGAAEIDTGAMRTIIWGGAPMHVADTLKAIERFGPKFAQIYGQGESPMTITTLTREEIADATHPRYLDRLASAGRPYGCVEVAIFDDQDRPLPSGEIGEIVCRGPTVVPAYWKAPEASAKTFAGGWLHTGDVGTFDAAGYLTLKDRSKDMIISGGTNIYPREVEEVLLMHAKVREASVIGRADAEWGEVVVAFVVGDVTPAELDRLCLERIARFKRPKDYVFVSELPKNNYGKILKTTLREQDAARVQAMQGQQQ